MIRFCSLVTAAALLSVPALRLLTGRSEERASVRRDATAVFEARDVTFSAGALRAEADRLLARLAPGHGEVTAGTELAGRADGGTLHQWSFTCTTAPEVGAEGIPDTAELRYDADTGRIISIFVGTAPAGEPIPPLAAPTAKEAIQAARGWLPHLGLEGTGNIADLPEVHCPPRQLPDGPWRVWLRARETQGGETMTVQITVNPVTGGLIRAVVAERSAFPRFYLPSTRPFQVRRNVPPLPAVLDPQGL